MSDSREAFESWYEESLIGTTSATPKKSARIAYSHQQTRIDALKQESASKQETIDRLRLEVEGLKGGFELSPQSKPVTEEREAFELHIKTTVENWDETNFLIQGDGSYLEEFMRLDFEMWQAGAAWQARAELGEQVK